MAKKGQPIQLQVEVATDEEWDKLLTRDGLIIVDVYSDWCGSCQGMSPHLKKIKLEVGGDMLHLAIAKSDHITPLERYRGKSEPTWMFISKGKVTNLMFGANSPKLCRLILQELKKEEAIQAGEITREEGREVTELFEEEQARYIEIEKKAAAKRQKESEKRAKELFERRTAEAKQIIENVQMLGTMIVLPNARQKYAEIVTEVLHDIGLIVVQSQKFQFTESSLEELFYFAPEIEFNEATVADMLQPEHESLICLLKPSRGSTVEDVHPAVLEMVYGPTLNPPGGKDSLYERLKHEEEDEEGITELTGIWAPHTDFLYATVLRMFFPKYSAEYTIPEPEPTPPYIAMVFDQKKTHDVMHVMAQYPNEIMHYGFFTSEVPSKTELVAKSVRKLDKVIDKRTFNEKMVLQVSKKKSECIFALAQLTPIYMSPNAEEGERECQLFFPEGYADDLNEEDFAYDELDSLTVQEEESIEEGELMNVEGDLVDEEEVSEGESEEEDEGDEEVFDDLFGFD
ncbi:unnamed protein product [Acanthoscelides obtectus]|uniref:Thioredoxin domain-containing protein n=2 Tax=Acanthoscelides obtectus TaxID=200917 RepID=A0A9P0Q1J5_ACAOB|nr:unnamed protein product [Acanthoscelides obtectus]CAK1648506.1 Thioredoxin domain-containing protein 6 [Acanthoscelides obtectus]